jgi:PAS domain S-box-containing protein
MRLARFRKSPAGYNDDFNVELAVSMILPTSAGTRGATTADRTLRAPLMAVAVVGVAALVQSLPGLPRVVGDRSFLILVVLTIASSLADFRMLGAHFTFSVSDSFTMTAAVLFGPAPATVLAAFDAFAITLRLSPEDRAAGRVFYNTTAPALAMWIAAHAFDALAPAAFRAQPTLGAQLVIPLMVFAALYFLLYSGFIALAVAGERHESLPHVWATYFAKLWLTFFVGASLAGLVVLLAGIGSGNSMVIVLLVPVVIVLYAEAHGAVEQLRERREHLAERELFATALGSTADAVLLTDPGRRVTFMNPAAERLTGWSDADARGRADIEVFRVCDPATREPNLDAAARDGAVVADYILIRPDGTECAIEEMHAPIRDDSGQLRGLVWTFRDIAERKAMDAKREALLLMEQDARAAAVTANRMKDEFLAAVSHELRTPATSILGWARLLRGGRLDEQGVKKALDALERSAHAQATVLNDLVDTSRVVRGALRLELRQTAVMTPLGEAIETLEPAIKAKELRLGVTVQSTLPTIDADADRLRQVFWNLLSNAIKFTAVGGRIDVSARHADHEVVIEVSDNGQGIDPSFLPFVFEKFRQYDGSMTRVHGGLGLGLTIVRYVVESHGGAVEASSEGLGRGARFTVRLPITSPGLRPDQMDDLPVL